MASIPREQLLKEVEDQERVSGELQATRNALQERVDALENQVQYHHHTNTTTNTTANTNTTTNTTTAATTIITFTTTTTRLSC